MTTACTVQSRLAKKQPWVSAQHSSVLPGHGHLMVSASEPQEGIPAAAHSWIMAHSSYIRKKLQGWAELRARGLEQDAGRKHLAEKSLSSGEQGTPHTHTHGAGSGTSPW